MQKSKDFYGLKNWEKYVFAVFEKIEIKGSAISLYGHGHNQHESWSKLNYILWKLHIEII